MAFSAKVECEAGEPKTIELRFGMSRWQWFWGQAVELRPAEQEGVALAALVWCRRIAAALKFSYEEVFIAPAHGLLGYFPQKS